MPSIRSMTVADALCKCVSPSERQGPELRYPLKFPIRPFEGPKGWQEICPLVETSWVLSIFPILGTRLQKGSLKECLFFAVFCWSKGSAENATICWSISLSMKKGMQVKRLVKCISSLSKILRWCFLDDHGEVNFGRFSKHLMPDICSNYICGPHMSYIPTHLSSYEINSHFHALLMKNCSTSLEILSRNCAMSDTESTKSTATLLESGSVETETPTMKLTEAERMKA